MKIAMNPSSVALNVKLLGDVGVLITEGKHIHFEADKRYQLLAYLAYDGGWLSREKLADLFWSDVSEVARQNLRKLLSRTQHLDWLVGLEVERNRVRWQVATDTATFQQALEANNIEQALAAYGGTFLKNLDSYEDTAFGSWLEIERERLHTQWRALVLSHAQSLNEQGAYHSAALLLNRLLEEDTFDEEALVVYLITLQRMGQGKKAIAAYQTFTRKLQREIGLKPSSATQLLAEKLEQSNSAALPLSASSAFSVTTPLVPTAQTSFIGRASELAEITSLLGKFDCRLLTLLSPGGVGKTRVALQAAHELLGYYPDGVYFVPLESVMAATAIPVAIAEVLNLSLQGREPPFQQVIRALNQKQLLLILDNFEHLIEGGAITTELLQACPYLNLLVTSRERLQVQQEWSLTLEGLSFSTTILSLAEAQVPDAVTLFIERAQRVCPSFAVTHEVLPHLLRICDLLLGLPLGIELSAVWVRVMSCEEIATALEQSLDLLSSPVYNIPERQRSLRATFEYSWQLLTAQEHDTLRSLSVFRGGFSKEAAVFVASANLALLAALVDKSLLRVSKGRYEFHPLVLQYAYEKLCEQPDVLRQTQAKHVTFYLNLAELAEAELKGASQRPWLQRLDAELDNLRAALSRALEIGDGLNGLRLSGALYRYWYLRGYLSEGRRFLAAALALTAAADYPSVRLKALNAAGFLARAQGEYKQAYTLFETCLPLAKQLGDEASVADVFGNLGLLAHEQGDYKEARSFHKKSLRIKRTIQDSWGIAASLNNLGIVAYSQGDYATAQVYHQESLTIRRELGDEAVIAASLNNLGLVAEALGNLSTAQALYNESLSLRRVLGDRRGVALALNNLANLARDRGDYIAAQGLYSESLEIVRDLGDRWGATFVLSGLASLVAVQGKFTYAIRLWGALEVLREVIGAPLPPRELHAYETLITSARKQLKEDEFLTGWIQGRTMGFDKAINYALTFDARHQLEL